MQRLKPESSRRTLNLPIYKISPDRERKSKGGFIDSNRMDTVLLAQLAARKGRFENMGIGEFATNEEFSEIIFNKCYKALEEEKKTIFLSDYYTNGIFTYLENFFLKYELGVFTKVNEDYDYHTRYDITLKLKGNISFDDIKKAYIAELKRFEVPAEDIEEKISLRLIKK